MKPAISLVMQAITRCLFLIKQADVCYLPGINKANNALSLVSVFEYRFGANRQAKKMRSMALTA